jgi:starvation-inducible outer membrane lipoprotein
MKGILVVMLALCLGACASQPQKVDVDPATPSHAAIATPSSKVYLDAYDRVPVQAPVQARKVLVLGAGKG